MKNSDFENVGIFKARDASLDVCNFALRAKIPRIIESRVSHRDDSILQLSSPLPFPFRGNAYILSIRFVGIMAPSGTSRTSFSARGAEFHDRGGRRESFPGKRNKIRHAFLFDLPRFPAPRHPVPPRAIICL